MHEAKRHRAKCSRVRGFEPLFRLSARRRGILSGQCGFGASRFKHLRRQEASARSFRAFSTSGGFEASMFEHFRRQEASELAFSSISRRQEASERAFSSIFDVRRPRGQHFRPFSTPGGSGARIFEVFRTPRRPALLHHICMDGSCAALRCGPGKK